MLVFLAGAIDLIPEDEARNWRDIMKAELQVAGISSFDPAAAFRYIISGATRQDSKKLMNINYNAIQQCDAAIIVMSKNIPSIGTPMELLLCHQEGIRNVVVWNPNGTEIDKAHIPAYINGLADQVVGSFDEALEIVKRISMVFRREGEHGGNSEGKREY